MENSEKTQETTTQENTTWIDFFFNTLTNVQSTTEGFQKILEKMQQDQHIAWTEWSKLYEAFVAQTQDKKTEIEAQLSKIVQKIAQNLNFVTKQEFDELQKRVEKLENK
ncbi:MAG: hypothetical protein EAZ44_02030 [Cytophagia bacterium]|nr:MAG: hypothetical protein EAZ44_02030 [Cytophagia bacterium]TAG42713.1 MAG: hypothetical protein EAZ31_05560 [Cytophagia bacterium]